MALINCGLSYNQDISGCAEDLEFTLPELDVEAPYVVKFTYPNGFKVNHSIVTDENASFTIQNQGWWNTGTGPVVVEVYKANFCNTDPFVVCDVTYTSMTLNFTNIQTDDTTATIPCTCPE